MTDVDSDEEDVDLIYKFGSQSPEFSLLGAI